MSPYDAILGYDWLKEHSPMQFDWNKKTIHFIIGGQHMKLQGLTTPSLQPTPISTNKLFNAAKGNDTWVYAIISSQPTNPPTTHTEPPIHPPFIQNLLDTSLE
jgi:hypothetical protein